MPRANRHFLSSHVWHITHRCHEREFLLRFARDRRYWRRRLYEARKRHGLCVLNYIVTCNHVHLLVRDRGQGEIARSMQLIAGRVSADQNPRLFAADPMKAIAAVGGCRRGTKHGRVGGRVAPG
jgi:putative transposase